MTTIFIVILIILIISQLVCFYLIFIMNTKINKFNDFETRQEKLMKEMENTISVYLLEMKEENDRFIHELSNIKSSQQANSQTLTTVQPKKDVAVNAVDEQNNQSLEQMKPKIENIQVIPKTVVQNAYNRQKELPKSQQETQQKVKEEKQSVQPQITNNEETIQPETKIETIENQILSLHQEGKTIEEIAKITQKGKTEIELLLKFHTET